MAAIERSEILVECSMTGIELCEREGIISEGSANTGS